MTVTSRTTMWARFASAAFSRAMSSAPFGTSIERIVNANPVDLKVPDVWVSLANETDAHEARARIAAASAPASHGVREERVTMCRR